jgi:hypothetical protein
VTLEGGEVADRAAELRFELQALMLTTKIEPDLKLYVRSCNMAKWPTPCCSMTTTTTMKTAVT